MAETSSTGRTKSRRWLGWLLLRAALYYLAAAVVIALLQRRLIYQATKLTVKDAAAVASANGFQPWKNAAGKLIGWMKPARTDDAGAVLLFHGNAGWAGERDYLAAPIQSASSLAVYILEYPGYGSRDGSPSQGTILAAGEEAFATLTNQPPIYLVSESLGAGVAAHIAKKHMKQIAGVVLFAPYDNFVSVAQRRMPIFPVSLMLWDRYAPDRWLAEYGGPLAVTLAGADEIIPVNCGRKLYDSYAGPKKLWLIEGSSHNDIAAQSPDWWKQVFAFLREHQKKS